MKPPTIINPITIQFVVAFRVCTTKISQCSGLIWISVIVLLNVQILQFFQAQPFTVDRYTEIAQIDSVLGAGHLFHVTCTARQRNHGRFIRYASDRTTISDIVVVVVVVGVVIVIA